jgi:hypothetical protein
MSVQRTVRERLGARMKALDTKYDALSERNGGQASISDGLDALKDLGGLIVEAKKIQVEALNAQGFSLAEYGWTRTVVYQAAGVPFSMDFDKVVRAAQSGQAPTEDVLKEAVTGNVPEKNTQLVAPHVEALRESAGLAFFGL